jgi:hypothetical protein
VQRGAGADTSRSDAVVRGGMQLGTFRKVWIGDGEDIDVVQRGVECSEKRISFLSKVGK